MYPSSTSSSSQGSMGPSGSGGTGSSGLMRYGSAPGSLLTAAVDSVVGRGREFSRFFSSDPSESISKDGSNNGGGANNPREQQNKAAGLQRSYGFNEMATGGGSGGGGGVASSSRSTLIRHSSSPAGFLNQLATAAGDNGITRLNSQLSFTRPETLSRISEENENVVDAINMNNGQRKSTHSYTNAGFGMGTWDDDNAIMFSAPPTKRAKNISSEVVNDLNTIESQFHFSISETALEMAAMDKLLHIPEDSVPCKIRAKRGCATHPRSIAERERRTRISGKLKKLQDLVPNMDKQTSYADMLDLAVQHIKTLQNQVQKLNEEVENCTCGCKTTSDS
ncbi:transcription factor bHLH128-like isoform X2 [Olea europaea subsp. europaea]|uniref:Transcription factor bHLH128-like isoform X2 n=1 Tax=Olea europaea subsp. europaea TaxID=158383 RepID=A0A8S0PA06_OLEEU|nr:transcription factor bHLH128-like isoform X2 [Olea europaea subsp. europaea]